MCTSRETFTNMSSQIDTPSLSTSLFCTAWLCLVMHARIPSLKNLFADIRFKGITIPGLCSPLRPSKIRKSNEVNNEVNFRSSRVLPRKNSLIHKKLYSFLVGTLREATFQPMSTAQVARVEISPTEIYELAVFSKSSGTDTRHPPSVHAQRESAICALRAAQCYLATMDRSERSSSHWIKLAMRTARTQNSLPEMLHSESNNHAPMTRSKSAHLAKNTSSLRQNSTDSHSSSSSSSSSSRRLARVNLGVVQTATTRIECRLFVAHQEQ